MLPSFLGPCFMNGTSPCIWCMGSKSATGKRMHRISSGSRTQIEQGLAEVDGLGDRMSCTKMTGLMIG